MIDCSIGEISSWWINQLNGWSITSVLMFVEITILQPKPECKQIKYGGTKRMLKCQ